MPHGAITKPLFVTSTLVDGGTDNLAKGQLAIVKNKAGANGAIAISDFAGMSKKERIKIRVGVGRKPTGLRTKQVPFQETGYFPMEGILSIKAYAPTNVTLKVDHFEVGYNGLSTSEGLFVPEGKSAVMDIVIYGHPMAMFFGQKEHIVTKRVYRKDGQTMQEVVRKLVKDLQNESVPTTMSGMYASSTEKLSDYLEIGVIDSTTEALQGTPWITSTINVEDAGESNDEAAIQAQYPLYKVVRTDRRDGISTYSILHLASDTLSNAVITKTDVTGKGCAKCQVGYSELEGGVVYHVSLEDDGLDSTAIVEALPDYVAGTALKIGQDNGVGTYSVVVEDSLTDAEITTFLTSSTPITTTAVVRSLGNVESVCTKVNNFPYKWIDGETCYASSEAFNIVLEDSECGTSRLSELQLAYPQLVITEGEATGNVAKTATLSGTTGALTLNIGGDGYVTAFDTDLETTATNFVTTHASTILTATGAIVTSNAEVITIKALIGKLPTIVDGATGITATLSTSTIEVVPSAGGCKRTYSTVVNTNLVCDECSDEFLQPFYAEAPTHYNGTYWTEVPLVYDENAKMGIFIKGKKFKLVPETYEMDWIPFIETSTKIRSTSFGVREQDYLNFVPAYDVDTEFAEVRQLQYAQDVNNLSQSLYGWETLGREFYQGDTQFKQNLFARANFSQESLLKLQKRMVQYHITYQDTSLSQGFGGRSNITHSFPIIVEQGKHQPIENLLNSLAGRLGLENVSIAN